MQLKWKLIGHDSIRNKWNLLWQHSRIENPGWHLKNSSGFKKFRKTPPFYREKRKKYNFNKKSNKLHN
jgi:hypothetical protein